MQRWCRSLLPAVLALAPVVAGCGHPDRPDADVLETVGTWPPELKRCLAIGDGTWDWQWRQPGNRSGCATSIVAGDVFRWRLAGEPRDTVLVLTPADPEWLALEVAAPGDLAGTPPLPRSPLVSDAWPDLVSMLRALITPRFDAVVTHWPDVPIPVNAPDAVSGDVDLAACLREAVEIWNSGEPAPHFVWKPDASWGVRLAHYAGSIREPPLQAQLTRRNDAGQPLALRIAAGDNYASPASRKYAVRGLAHELGHALLLWGHSPDRRHLLWGDAPPLIDGPSEDERRAVRLLQRLPAGLDLTRYRATAPP